MTSHYSAVMNMLPTALCCLHPGHVQESFSGGLGLLDLEQLLLEKAGLGIKLAGRDHERARFMQKRRDTVQVSIPPACARACVESCQGLSASIVALAYASRHMHQVVCGN